MDINGYGSGRGGSRGGRRSVGGAVTTADLYRRVPKEMTEATKLGFAMSLLSILLMAVLFVCETRAFARTTYRSSVRIDHRAKTADETLHLRFNLTLYDVHCDFVSVDVWDTLGTNLQNVTKDITKWHIDDRGQKQKFHGRNTQRRRIKHQKHKETLHDIANSNGGELHSTDLTPDNLAAFHEGHDLAMIDYHAPWCLHCQRLAPTWEKFAAEAARRKIGVGVGRVDCVAHPQMCKDERVMAFPTLRWVEKGKSVKPDYGGDRTVEALVGYAQRRAADRGGGGGRKDKKDDDEKDYEGDDDDRSAAAKEWDEEHHPGCQVSGRLTVNRVPGNLHVEAYSPDHEINAAMTNLTHRVNGLTFGTPGEPSPGRTAGLASMFGNVPMGYDRVDPMRGGRYPSDEFHTAFHHHMKVVGSRVDHPFFSRDGAVVYQILEESQLVIYEPQEVPEIKFLWDMSPMSVSLTKEGRRWYEYVTNLLAIIGGTYTTLGLINATLLRIFKPKRL